MTNFKQPHQVPLFPPSVPVKGFIAGVDEAGRGPLCGEVYAAAVILPKNLFLEGLRDSKQLTEKKREVLREIIIKEAVSYAIASSSIDEIEQYNILGATLLAMKRAIIKLTPQPHHVRVDGNQLPRFSSKRTMTLEAVIGGDRLYAEISAASILAKTARDASMAALHREYPHFGFLEHKGYGTKAHLEAIERYGITPYHRPSFAPIKKWLATQKVIK